MTDLLFEIGTEELPSWYPAQASADLESLLTQALESAGISHGHVTTFSTPRRLALLVRDLADSSERRSEKRRGPPVSAAFDADGRHTRAALGFAAANGVTVEALTVEESGRGEYLYATVETGGEATKDLLPALLSRLVAAVPAPRKMRWGTVEEPFVRPVAWLLALYGTEVLTFSAAGQTAGRSTRGHRFLSPGELQLTSPDEYLQALENASVSARPDERRELTRKAVAAAAAERGLVMEEDDELLDEVTGLVEYPFPILGTFAEHYLELPEEVLTTVLITHQRFFPLRRPDGSLAPAFIGVSNNRVTDEAVVRKGYEQVLDGRLYDARFFWDSDRSRSLAQHAWGLSGVGYQRELGSMADKVARTGVAARALAELTGLTGSDLDDLNAAVPLFRADLVTGMVYEFPELEGVMARAYALAEGQPAGVAAALGDGVLPKGPGSPLPVTAAGTVLAAADKLEKILGFIAIGRRPTGSADPFALRRDGISLARLLAGAGWQVTARQLLEAVAPAFEGSGVNIDEAVLESASQFIAERVHALLQEEGIQVQVIRAATAGQVPVIAAARSAHLLAALLRDPHFGELGGLYRRAANIAADVMPGALIDGTAFTAPEEEALYRALPAADAGVDRLSALAEEHLQPWDLGAGPGAGLTEAADVLGTALAGVLELKQPLDDFLDNLHVMVDDRAVRTNRLALLGRVRDILLRLGALEELAGL